MKELLKMEKQEYEELKKKNLEVSGMEEYLAKVDRVCSDQ
jgi:hypothetical protein